MAALVAALWAYDGWNDLNMVSGEIKQPERTIPIALIAGVAVVAVLYMLTNAAVQYVLPADQIAASPRPASDATAIAVGAWGAAIVSAGMALSMLVGLNGTIMSGARVPYAMARDGYFFKAMADVHPRFHTPSVALIVQLLLSIVLLLFGGNFRQLFSLTIFAEWLFYMIAASTVFVLRKKEPNTPRPYQTWGYPVVPAVFVLVAAVLLYFTFTENLRNSIWGCVLILSGIPIFVYFGRGSGRSRLLRGTPPPKIPCFLGVRDCFARKIVITNELQAKSSFVRRCSPFSASCGTRRGVGGSLACWSRWFTDGRGRGDLSGSAQKMGEPFDELSAGSGAPCESRAGTRASEGCWV